MLEEQFDEYKAEFSREETTAGRKNELIVQMQDNLKRRINSEAETKFYIEGQEYSVESEIVEHLYIINGFLRQQESQKQLSALAEIAKQQALGRNKYGPTNPYPSN